jgi:hypothetical protein
VRGEYAQVAHAIGVERPFGFIRLAAAAREALQQLDRCERGMTFVEMVGANLEAQCLQDAYPAHAKQKLLLQPIHLVSTVQVMRQVAVLRIVLLEIGIEEQDGNRVADVGFMDVHPRAHPYIPPFDLHADHCSERPRPTLDLPRVWVLDLPTICVDFLPEIAVAAQERDEDHGQLEVGGGAHRVTRKNPQTAGICVNLHAERELHREVSNVGLRKESA